MSLDDDVHKPVYELKTGKEEDFPKAQARLQDFIQHLVDLNGEAFDQWIAAHMDVDLLLRTYDVVLRMQKKRNLLLSLGN